MENDYADCLLLRAVFIMHGMKQINEKNDFNDGGTVALWRGTGTHYGRYNMVRITY